MKFTTIKSLWNYQIPENTSDDSSRKKAIKLLVIFLLLAVLFTLVSRGLRTFTMPEVNLETPQRRGIFHQIKGQGVIEPEVERAIFSIGDLKIESVYVRPGSVIEEGAPLIRVSMDHLDKRIGELENRIQVIDLNIADIKQNQSVSNQQRGLEQNRAVSDLHTAADTFNQQVNDAAHAVDLARNALDFFLNTVSNLYEYEDDIIINEAEIQQKQTELEQALNSAIQNYNVSISERNNAINQGNRRVEDSNLPSLQNSSADIARIEREVLQESLIELSDLRDKEGIIVSPMQATIVSIDSSVRVGGITPQLTLMNVVDKETEFRFVVTLPRETQENFKIGDLVNLELSWNRHINNLTIDHITRNEEDHEKIDVVVQVPSTEDVRLFETADITIDGGGDLHSRTLPLSALQVGGAGESDFVLVVREENTILGTQFVVEAVPVTVKDKDESFFAVGEFDLSNTHQVIVNSLGEVRAGDRVLIN